MTQQDLTFAGLTEDGQRLLLIGDAGEEFTLRVDARVRAAVRGESARPGQREKTMESSLRPRDIQTRIRSGQSPETVADAAQTSVDRVMTYALPVLAERAHVAERGQRATVRRSDGEAPVRALGDTVAPRLVEAGGEPDAAEWDAWRRDDGRWTLVLDYGSGDAARHAEFTYDLAGNYVVADDDAARTLLGEPTVSPDPTGSVGALSRAGARRLTSVPADELPLGEDAIELVTEPAPAVPARSADPTDWIAAPAQPTADEPVELGSEADDDAGADGADQDTEDTERVAQVARAVGETPRAVGSRKRRPTVPSWDEIMFGGGERD